MFGFFKNLLGKPAPQPVGEHLSPTHKIPSPEPDGQTPSQLRETTPAFARYSGPQPARGMELPLESIIKDLPAELQCKLKPADLDGLTFPVPLEKILAQLSRGAIKITFGELRRAAPQAFSSGTDRDRVLITLPLPEILSRLNPNLIKRRRVQKQVEIPAEIISPFDSQRNQAPSPLSMRAESPQSGTPEPPGLSPALARPQAETPAPPLTVNRGSISFAPTPPPPSAVPPAAADVPPVPAARPAYPRPEPKLGLATNRSVAPPPSPVSTDAECLELSLGMISVGWPDAVRKEIAEQGLANASVAVPAELLDHSLRQGRIAFGWKTLRSWMKPAPSGSSELDETMLELPLKLVAPLYLARRRKANARQKVAVDETIPNLFFGFPQPEPPAASPAAAPQARQTDTNYFAKEQNGAETPAPAPKSQRESSPGTRFVVKHATPNEVVSRAAALDGVAGALIALPDGLLVASRLASDANADTLAAFLPQIFSKLSQCTKELRLGELNNLNFTVGNTAWKIFRVNAIFFAAFARSGEPLPTAQLAALAGELDHKTK